MSSAAQPAAATRREDPVVRSARREAIFSFTAWGIALAYTVGYCVHYGYGRTEPVERIWGIPDWILWGIIAPWLCCVVLSGIFASLVMTDEDLGEEAGAILEDDDDLDDSPPKGGARGDAKRGASDAS